MSKLTRIDLPSGGWWELDTNPPWGKVRQLAGEKDDTALLATLTTVWSFPEPVTAEAINCRDTADVITILEVVFNQVLPLFDRLVQANKGSSTRLSGLAK